MDIKPKKSLGQNFLIDKNILKKIISLGKIEHSDNILEIGSGTGNLTKFFLEKKFNKLILIEKDKRLIRNLKLDLTNIKNIQFINDDILKLDLEKIISGNMIIFGNLPYNISSQILIQLIKFKNWLPKYKKLVLMFQKEVGEKIISNFGNKNYSRLGIISKFRLKVKKRFSVSKNSFYPKPKVDSMVIIFEPWENKIKIDNLNNLEKITHEFFSKKRKKIKKTFQKIFKDWEKAAKDLKIDINLRPQNLSENQYYEITSYYEKIKF